MKEEAWPEVEADLKHAHFQASGHAAISHLSQEEYLLLPPPFSALQYKRKNLIIGWKRTWAADDFSLPATTRETVTTSSTTSPEISASATNLSSNTTVASAVGGPGPTTDQRCGRGWTRGAIRK